MPLAAFPKCFLDALCVSKMMTPAGWIDLAADELDVDGLEFYAGFTPMKDPTALANLRRRAQERGLRVPMMCYSPDFTQPDPAARAAERERAHRTIDATAALGGSYCRVLSGQRRPEVPLADGVKWAAECIVELLPYAEQKNVVLVLENHYKDGYWQYPELAQKREIFLELLHAIPPSPFFGVNYDPSNALIADDDPLELLDAVLDRMVTMHASDRYFEGGTLDDLRKTDAHPQQGYAPMLKHGVIGQGMIPYDAIFARLRDAGFTGWISIEDGQDPATGIENLRESAVFLRRKMREYGLP